MEIAITVVVFALLFGFTVPKFMALVHKAQEGSTKHKLVKVRSAIAAYYAMALVQTDQVGERVYDIRLDYDTLHVVGWDNCYNNGNSIYFPEGNYYAGLVETSYHYAFEKHLDSRQNKSFDRLIEYNASYALFLLRKK